MERKIFAFFISPLAGASLDLLATYILATYYGNTHRLSALDGFLKSYTIFLILWIAFGWPMRHLLTRFRRTNCLSYALGASIATGTPAAIFFAYWFPQGKIGLLSLLSLLSLLYPIGLFATGGALIGVTFWLIARPDRDRAVLDAFS